MTLDHCGKVTGGSWLVLVGRGAGSWLSAVVCTAVVCMVCGVDSCCCTSQEHLLIKNDVSPIYHLPMTACVMCVQQRLLPEPSVFPSWKLSSKTPIQKVGPPSSYSLLKLDSSTFD